MSADLLVLCPTRGRPGAAQETYDSFMATRPADTTTLLFVVDDDDPFLDEYLVAKIPTIHQPAPGSMVKALNEAALWDLREHPHDVIGFVGDDHRFRTPMWDAKVTEALAAMGGGFVYGNDLAQGERLATQVFISSKIIKALGWMGLPACHHLYIDNAWMVIGGAIDRIRYLPDVVIEHMHPIFGKGAWDEGHLRVNTQALYDSDGVLFQNWLDTQAEADIKRVRAAL